ncbi:MAG: T9SS type B sorting domain-containing protein [Flavobacteriales bacterium]|nr:T9SS type B sorting domain-containing protein [Flavobacteriales bacterium]
MKQQYTLYLLLLIFVQQGLLGQQNLLTNGDFEGTGGFESHYDTNGLPGSAGVSSNPQIYNPKHFIDSADNSGSGNMLIVDSSSDSNKKFWQTPGSIKLQGGTEYVFSYFVKDVNINNNIEATIQFNPTDQCGCSTQTHTVQSSGDWTKVTHTFTPSGSGERFVRIELTSIGAEDEGYDFAIDDISLTGGCTPETISFTVSDDIPLCEEQTTQVTTTSSVPGEWKRLQGFATIVNPTSKTTDITNLIYNNQFVVKWVPTLTDCQSLAPGTDDTVTILAKDRPQLDPIPDPVPISCTVSEVTVSVKNAGTTKYVYKWEKMNGGTVEKDLNINNATAKLTEPGDYRVSVSIQSSGIFTIPCESFQSVTVPSIGIGSPAPTVDNVNYCVGDATVSLASAVDMTSVASGNTLLWYTQATGGTGSSSAPTPSSANAGTTSYYVVQVEGTCESPRAQIDVIVADASATVANPATTIINCTGTPITLDGSGSSAGQYQWQRDGVDIGGETNNTISVGGAGTYRLVVTSPAGCSDTSNAITIEEDSNKPSVSIADPVALTCTTTSLTLDASASTPAPAANITYIWTNSSGTELLRGQDVSATQLTVNTADTYTLTIENSSNSCTGTGTKTVVQDTTKPTVVIQTPTDKLTCTVQSVTVTTTGSSTGTNFSYEWKDSKGTTVGTSQTLTATAPDTYLLTITNSDNGCQSSNTVKVESDVTDPQVTIAVPTKLTCSVLSVTLDGSASTTGPTITYQWTTSGGGNIVSGSTTSSAVVDQPGTYTLTVTDTTKPGCPATKTVQVERDETPAVATIKKLNDLGCSNKQALIDSQGSDVGSNYTYLWTTTNGNIVGSDTGIQITVDQPGDYVLTITNTTTGCSRTSNTVTIIDESAMPNVVPATYEVCSTGVDGVGDFELRTQDLVLTNNNSSLGVSYHLTLADAQSNMSPLNKNNYTNTSDPQVVFARVTDSNGCSTEVELTLEVRNGPTKVTPPALEYCDPNSDGFGVFTLGDADAGILGSQTGMTLTYHETPSDAVASIKPLSKTSPYSNRDRYDQTIYARVENAEGCYIIVNQALKVKNTPRTEKATAFIMCDVNNPGDKKEGFDLTSKESEVLKNLNKTLHTVSYYQSLSNAEAGTSAIANKTNYTNQSVTETIYMKVTETATGCSSIEPIELEVAQRPVVVEPALYVVCDDNNPGDGKEVFNLKTRESEITGATTIPMEVTYYTSKSDAENKVKAISTPESYINKSSLGAVESVHVRVEHPTTGCYSTTILDIRVDPLPSPKAPSEPLISCDPDADGFAVFPLETLSTEIADKDGANVKISYHETQADALIVANAIAEDPTTGEITYKNIQNAKNGITIYAAAKHNTTGCVRVVPVTLRAEPSPQVPVKLAPLEECDDLSTGKQNDGLAQFDLTQHEATIYANQSKTNLEITYHISEADAQNNVNPIADPKHFENTVNQVTTPSASPQQIWAALRHKQTDCSRSIAITLKVNPQPEPAKSIEYSICDDETKDEKTTFDLTSQISLITQGATQGYDLLFYETEADAKSGSNANIKNPIAYENTINKQTIYVRVIDQDSQCAAISNLILRVNNNPTPEQPAPLEICDKDDASTNQSTGDGIALFDLTERQIEIENQEGSVSLSYYTTEASAKEGGTDNQITTPTAFENTDLYEQTIYVRAEYDLTGCSSVVPLELKVLALPEPSSIPDYVQCSPNNDGSYAYDLQEYNATILGGSANVGKYDLTYYGTEAAAEAGAIDTQLNSPYVSRGSITSPEEVWVRIQQKGADCYVTRNFNLVVGESINLKAHDDIQACGTPSTPGSSLLEAEIDLTQYETAILDGLDASIHSFSYYKVKNNDKLSQPIADPTKYVNSKNKEKIYIKVTRADGCEDTRQELNLEVKLKPEPKPDPEYIICSDPDTGILLPGSTAVIDTKLVEATHTFEWKLDGQIITGATGSKYTAIAPGKYTVIATSRSTPCASDEIAVNVVLSSQATIVKAYTVDPQFSQDSYTVKVEVIGSGDYEYQIDGGPFQDSAYFENVAPGLHQVGVQDKRGCQGLPITANLYATTYMKYFTPNGDGINDEWHIVGLESQSNARVYIYDRYGKLLKEMQVNEDKGWDGTFRGNPMPATDYWFRVQFEENKEIKEFRSHFALKR